MIAMIEILGDWGRHLPKIPATSWYFQRGVHCYCFLTIRGRLCLTILVVTVPLLFVRTIHQHLRRARHEVGIPAQKSLPVVCRDEDRKVRSSKAFVASVRQSQESASFVYYSMTSLSTAVAVWSIRRFGSVGLYYWNAVARPKESHSNRLTPCCYRFRNSFTETDYGRLLHGKIGSSRWAFMKP
jgi:hypothetical protein